MWQHPLPWHCRRQTDCCRTDTGSPRKTRQTSPQNQVSQSKTLLIPLSSQDVTRVKLDSVELCRIEEKQNRRRCETHTTARLDCPPLTDKLTLTMTTIQDGGKSATATNDVKKLHRNEQVAHAPSSPTFALHHERVPSVSYWRQIQT